jgi:UMP-CMP kinase
VVPAQATWIPIGRDKEDYAEEVYCKAVGKPWPPQADVEPENVGPTDAELAQAEAMAAQSARRAELEGAGAGRSVVCVLGGPGSGKSSHCARLATGLGYEHISVTKALKDAVLNGHEFRDEIAACMAQGKLVASETVVHLLQELMLQSSGPVLLDGFPRVAQQISAVDRLGSLKGVLFLDCPEDTLVQRLTKSVLTVPKFVFVLGGPGCGKGTQCCRLKEQFGFIHLSAGDLLRAEQKREGSAEAALIADCIREGQIVPAQITITLLRRAMAASPGATFLIDGFPRAIAQAEAFIEQVALPEFVLFFDVSQEAMTARIMERGKTSGRSDDNADALVKRFSTYVTQSFPVIERLDSLGLVRRVDATPSPDEVFENTKALFEIDAVADPLALMTQFTDHCLPVIDTLDSAGLVRRIDARSERTHCAFS